MIISDKDTYIELLRARIELFCRRIEEGEATPEFAAFEVLASLFSAHEGGIDTRTMNDAYPREDWRANQVTVPAAILRPIVEGWVEYQESSEKITIGEAFGLEGGGKGKRPVAATNRTRDKEQRLSNLVVLELLLADLDGIGISQDAAIAAVTEREAASYGTVRDAFQKLGPGTMKRLNSLR